jgi:hypothetical protein
MLAIRHVPWPIALMLAAAMLLLAAGLATGGGVGIADLISLAPAAPTEPPPRPRTWTEMGNNRMEVWERLQREADLLVLGQEMNMAERGRCVKALALALSLDDLEAARPYIDPLLAELRLELTRQMPEEAGAVLAGVDERALVRALYEARTGRTAAMTIGPFRAEVGIAAYRHWKTTVTQTPADRGEERQAMTDTYQPYLRLLMVLK